MLRVALVGDRAVPVAGLRGQLDEEGFFVTGVAPPRRGRGFEPVTAAEPDVVVVQSTACVEAFLLCRRLRDLARPQPVIAYIVRPTPRLEVAAWVAGASGLVTAATSAASLAEMVGSVATGRRRLPRPGIGAVRAAARGLAPVELAIFGMRMHDVSSEEISSALRLDPLELDRRTDSLIAFLSRDESASTRAGDHALDVPARMT